MSGTTMVLSNSFQISAGGSGLVGVADNCRFLFESVTGDFDARLQVVEVASEDDTWGHTGGSGLMIRAGLEAVSAQAAVLIRPSGNLFLERGEIQALARFSRSDTVEQVAWAGSVPSMNNWVLRREGNLVSMYYSKNGTRWDWLETVSLPLGPEAMIGIAASSIIRSCGL
jgi:hypothetical protein